MQKINFSSSLYILWRSKWTGLKEKREKREGEKRGRFFLINFFDFLLFHYFKIGQVRKVGPLKLCHDRYKGGKDDRVRSFYGEFNSAGRFVLVFMLACWCVDALVFVASSSLPSLSPRLPPFPQIQSRSINSFIQGTRRHHPPPGPTNFEGHPP